jgi:ABC-type phosphate transport system substrate-binding protein
MSKNPILIAGAFLVWTLASGGPLPAAAADLMIIAHPDILETAVDDKDVQRIYLGKLTRWNDEITIVPVMLKSGPLQDEFIERYLDRSVQRFVTYWRQMVFTGKGIPPKGFDSESELVAFVARTPGAVGFASAGTDLSGVKVLLRD